MSARILPLVLLSLPAGALAAAVTVPFVAGTPPGSSESAEALQRAAASLGDLARRMDDIERGMTALRAERPPSPDARVSLAEIESAVASYLERHDSSTTTASEADASAAGANAAAPAATAELGVDDAFARLTSGTLSEEQRQKLWAEMGKRGLSDALVARFEAAVEGSPNDPDLRVDLGAAYIQKIFEAGGSTPLAGMWAMKADRAFDAALALDDHHWEARFSKAVSYSFWPPALGMQNKAIAQFEMLIEQQQDQPPQPQFARTYRFLGTMYQQTGNPQKALQVWQQGLALFPGDDELKNQVALAQPH
jgi:tetratricopeptide (TPR) repeat protein